MVERTIEKSVSIFSLVYYKCTASAEAVEVHGNLFNLLYSRQLGLHHHSRHRLSDRLFEVAAS